MPVPRTEMESVVTMPWNDDEGTVSTTDPAHARAMEKRGLKPHRVSFEDAACTIPVAWVYRFPASWFKLPSPKKRIGEEQRARTGERMRKAHEPAL